MRQPPEIIFVNLDLAVEPLGEIPDRAAHRLKTVIVTENHSAGEEVKSGENIGANVVILMAPVDIDQLRTETRQVQKPDAVQTRLLDWVDLLGVAGKRHVQQKLVIEHGRAEVIAAKAIGRRFLMQPVIEATQPGINAVYRRGRGQFGQIDRTCALPRADLDNYRRINFTDDCREIRIL